MIEVQNSTVEIVNKKGLHARAAARFAKLANTFDAQVWVQRAGQEVCGKSIMGLLTLSASIGREITIKTHGNMAKEALYELVELVEKGFHEKDDE